MKLIWRPGIGLDISQRLCKLDQLLAVLANLAGEVLSDVPAGNTNHSYNMVGCNSLAYVQDWRWYMYVDIQPMLLIPSPLCNGRQHTCLCSSEGGCSSSTPPPCPSTAGSSPGRRKNQQIQQQIWQCNIPIKIWSPSWQIQWYNKRVMNNSAKIRCDMIWENILVLWAPESACSHGNLDRSKDEPLWQGGFLESPGFTYIGKKFSFQSNILIEQKYLDNYGSDTSSRV